MTPEGLEDTELGEFYVTDFSSKAASLRAHFGVTQHEQHRSSASCLPQHEGWNLVFAFCLTF